VSIVIPAGYLSVTLPILPIDDSLVEGPETVVLTLQSNPAYSLDTPGSATVTINDDEPMVTLTATVASVVEGSQQPGVFTLTRTGDPKYSFTVNLAVGGTATFTVTGTVQATATGPLVNTATVTVPVGTTDPTPGNNTVTDTDTQNSVADLQITKTDGSATYTPGNAITYTVVATNAGPSFVTGATVADTIPAVITGATWTAVYAGVGSSGPANGAGNISATVNLAVSGTATFTVTGTVQASATGNLVNTATITVPVGTTDPTPANNSATDTDTQNSVADLQITKTDGSATYTPGNAITYTVVATNAGPSFVTGATVADTIPAVITGATWTAVYAGAGSSGPAGGAGNITATDFDSSARRKQEREKEQAGAPPVHAPPFRNSTGGRPNTRLNARLK
jgi:uncharacterized repeat protein (TIGR01451 family)